KQIIIYNALGASLPLFAHVPMVLGSDKARLSKRHGAMSVSEYKDMGFLPDAMLNYLVRLGWSHGDQEFFTRKDLIAKFSLEHIGRSPSMFDMDKLIALNAKHIQSKAPSELVPILMFHLEKLGITPQAGTDMETDSNMKNGFNLEKIIETLQPRSKTMVEMAEASQFYFKDSVELDESAAKKFLKPDLLEPLKKSAQYIEAISKADFSEKNLEDIFKKVMEESNLKFGKIAQPLRVALTGTTVSPGIFEMILALGKEKTVKRIRQAVDHIESLQ
ncbi:MAG: glutamate--tRNA ligase, partial [Desulfamplus sp.]|nr:glutamate--tRNA ligase [Desulfamplus sp.]